MNSKHPLLFVLLAAGTLLGCGKVRENQLGRPQCNTEASEVAALLQPCAACHSGAAAKAGYRTDSYFEITARRPDGSARVVPGDADSAFLKAARGELPGHSALPEETVAQLTDWVVDCRANNTNHIVHPPGWVTPTDPEQFHGRVLRNTGYLLTDCQRCHGQDLRGGGTQISCYTCHPSGPLACNVCHGNAAADVSDLRNVAPPKDLSGATATTSPGVGAHQQHLNDGPLHKAYPCTVCHVLPGNPDETGHYREVTVSGEVVVKIDPAQIFDGGRGTIRGSPGRAPEWSYPAATCTNVYCHSPSPVPDTNALNTAPTWNRVGANEASCGTCHGIPPSTHADNRCAICHGVALTDGGVPGPSHANGTVDLGNAPAFAGCQIQPAPAVCACNLCHGDATTPAPPRDLLGRTSPTLPTVGAHRAHLEAPHKLRGPIACEECHQVPATVSSPGHLDTPSPAEVFPAGAGVLARADGADAGYNPATGSCTSYCHGSGALLAPDTSTGLNKSPLWTGGESQATCGTCHGLPPQTPTHPPGAAALPCERCHFPTVTSSGALKISVDPVTGAVTSTHLNGQIDLGGP